MDVEIISPSSDVVKCCNCGCSCSSVTSSSGTWLRSVKRKYDEFEDGNQFFVPGLDISSNARVQIENECDALRETVASQQQAIQDLYLELEEERNASSSAANEALSMILRLQGEKAEIQMEARQFKRFAEEKMAHDQEEVFVLEDTLYKREQAIQALSCEVQAYKHRMLSYGLSEAEAEGEKRSFSHNRSNIELDNQFDLPSFDYPPLKCNVNENPGPLECDNDIVDVEIYPFGETSRGQSFLENLDYRFSQIERSPRRKHLDREFSSGKNMLEKVIVGQSPRRSRHGRSDSSSSNLGVIKETGYYDFSSESPRFNSSVKKMEPVEEFPNLRRTDSGLYDGDDMSDRVYTIDSVHNGVQYNSFKEPKAGVGRGNDYISTPRDFLNQYDVEDPDIKKLYTRLHALEADRESMRQAIISMRTDKAQLVLLKEIAQHLCKEMTPERQMPVKKSSILAGFSFFSIFKWIVSFIFWRRRACRSKYSCGLSANNLGLLLLLESGPRMRQWRCLTSTQV